LEEARHERAAIIRAKQELEMRREELATEVGPIHTLSLMDTASILHEFVEALVSISFHRLLTKAVRCMKF
jgi:hypothetical protein